MDKNKKPLIVIVSVFTLLFVAIFFFTNFNNKKNSIDIEPNDETPLGVCDASKMNDLEVNITNYFNTEYNFITVNTSNVSVKRSPLISILSYNFNRINASGITLNILNNLNMLGYTNITKNEEDQLYIKETGLTKED